MDNVAGVKRERDEEELDPEALARKRARELFAQQAKKEQERAAAAAQEKQIEVCLLCQEQLDVQKSDVVGSFRWNVLQGYVRPAEMERSGAGVIKFTGKELWRLARTPRSEDDVSAALKRLITYLKRNTFLVPAKRWTQQDEEDDLRLETLAEEYSEKNPDARENRFHLARKVVTTPCGHAFHWKCMRGMIAADVNTYRLATNDMTKGPRPLKCPADRTVLPIDWQLAVGFEAAQPKSIEEELENALAIGDIMESVRAAITVIERRFETDISDYKLLEAVYWLQNKINKENASEDARIRIIERSFFSEVIQSGDLSFYGERLLSYLHKKYGNNAVTAELWKDLLENYIREGIQTLTFSSESEKTFYRQELIENFCADSSIDAFHVFPLRNTLDAIGWDAYRQNGVHPEEALIFSGYLAPATFQQVVETVMSSFVGDDLRTWDEYLESEALMTYWMSWLKYQEFRDDLLALVRSLLRKKIYNKDFSWFQRVLKNSPTLSLTKIETIKGIFQEFLQYDTDTNDTKSFPPTNFINLLSIKNGEFLVMQGLFSPLFDAFKTQGRSYYLSSPEKKELAAGYFYKMAILDWKAEFLDQVYQVIPVLPLDTIGTLALTIYNIFSNYLDVLEYVKFVRHPLLAIDDAMQIMILLRFYDNRYVADEVIPELTTLLAQKKEENDFDTLTRGFRKFNFGEPMVFRYGTNSYKIMVEFLRVLYDIVTEPGLQATYGYQIVSFGLDDLSTYEDSAKELQREQDRLLTMIRDADTAETLSNVLKNRKGYVYVEGIEDKLVQALKETWKQGYYLNEQLMTQIDLLLSQVPFEDETYRNTIRYKERKPLLDFHKALENQAVLGGGQLARNRNMEDRAYRFLLPTIQSHETWSKEAFNGILRYSAPDTQQFILARARALASSV